MKIDRRTIFNSLKSYRAQTADMFPRPGERSASETISADTVDISNRVQQMNAALEKIAAAPDIRQERVRPVKHQLDTATYSADLEQVADKLIDPDPGARI